VAARGLRVPGHIAEVIRGLHPETRRKIRGTLTAVLADPTIGDPLRDRLTGFRRVRIGRWRVVYRERPLAIEVFAVGPRATVYSELLARLDPPMSALVAKGKVRPPRGSGPLPRPLDLPSRMTSEEAIDVLRDE